jgi:hypothetical protein
LIGWHRDRGTLHNGFDLVAGGGDFDLNELSFLQYDGEQHA